MYTVKTFDTKRFGLIYHLYGIYNRKGELVTQGEAWSAEGAMTMGIAVAKKLNSVNQEAA